MNICTSNNEGAGTAIGYGGQFDRPLQTRFGLIFSSFDRPGKVPHPRGPPCAGYLDHPFAKVANSQASS